MERIFLKFLFFVYNKEKIQGGIFMENTLLLAEIKEKMTSLDQIKSLISTNSIIDWINALTIAKEQGLDELHLSITEQVVETIKPKINETGLKLNVYDDHGELQEPFTIAYKDEVIGYFNLDKGSISFIDIDERIIFYQQIEKMQKRNLNSKQKQLKESKSYIKLLDIVIEELGLTKEIS